LPYPRVVTENDYITELRSRWPRAICKKVSRQTITLADEAVRAFPKSCTLWVIRGDLLQLGPEDCPYPLEESLVCYKKAIEIDPKCSEAWESAAHFYDAVLADEQAAAPYFREFERLIVEITQQALSKIRQLSDEFIAGRLTFDEFYPQFCQHLGNFDPLDEMLGDFNASEQREIELYFRYIGGAFGEQEDFLPRLKSWEDGKPQEPYGWIDREKFFEMYARDYRNIRCA
jgi:hypothetical protein